MDGCRAFPYDVQDPAYADFYGPATPSSSTSAPARLREIGAWLSVNGEAIYGSRPWSVFGEGDTPVPKGFDEKAQMPYGSEDIRFTAKGDALYAIALGWPRGEWLVKTLGASRNTRPSEALGDPALLGGRSVKAVAVLGSPSRTEWSMSAEGLRVRAPAAKPCDHAFAMKIDLG